MRTAASVCERRGREGQTVGGGGVSKRLLLWLSAAGLALFVLLLVLEATGAGIPRLDRFVLLKVSAHRSASLVTACRYLTDVFSPPVDAAVLAIGALVLARRWQRWEPVVVALVAGWAVASVVLVVKYATHRPGPGVDVLYQGSTGSHGRSFPSGHTAMAVVAFGTLA